MLKNYFLVAFRNFWRSKVFSLINIVGLAIGISASLVIFLIVDYDFSFDKFQKDGDRIYRVVSIFQFAGDVGHTSGIPTPLPAATRSEIKGLDLVSFFRTWNDGAKLSVPGPKTEKPVEFKDQKSIVFADESYFKLIDYKWLAGAPSVSLKEPYQVVLTQSNAAIYFPGMQPSQVLGHEIIFSDTIHTTVAGVVADLAGPTDFSFKTFISEPTLESKRLKPGDWDDWNNVNSASQLFVKLSPLSNATEVEAQLNRLYGKNRKTSSEDHSSSALKLQPLSDLHFNSDYDNFEQRLAHKPTLYGLLAVAAFLLLLGCINFINLTTAQASQRAKEIGIRKTMGSSKRNLVFQFLSETFLLTIMATVLSIGLTPLLLKTFSDFIPDGLHFRLLEPGMLAFLAILVVAVSLLSGFYPALVLSSFKPIMILKNQAFTGTAKTRTVFFRKTLTVTQFVIAQVFIIATILVSKQISYSLNKSLGFKKDAIVYFTTNYYDTVKTNKTVLMEKLKAIPGIAKISLSNNPPSSNGGWTTTLKYTDGKKDIETNTDVKLGDTNYINLYQIKLVAGTNLPASDTVNAALINESLLQVLGVSPQQIIGKNIEWNNKQTPVVGVVHNFHQRSLHDEIKPLVIASWSRHSRTFNIALQPQNAEGTVWKTAIAQIKKAWTDVYPDDDFQLNFLDENIAKYYESEQNISKLLFWATGLAIFISLLGLLGLVIYITNQRTKEIGVRKVIGATILQIISLLSKDFLKLIAIAVIVAIPIAWWGANKWLQNFAYRTAMSWWVFVAGGMITILLALIVLFVRTFRAASANPVKSLRSE